MQSAPFHKFSRSPDIIALHRSLAVWLAGLALLLASTPVSAHAREAGSETASWMTWDLSPAIVIPAALVALIYLSGAFRRTDIADRLRLWRHAACAAGVGSVFLALASPLDHLAEHLFSVHQIQHLLLRMMGPMLIALSAPQAALISGLPSTLRHHALAPLVANRALRAVFSILTGPVVVTALFIAALFVWQFPRYHNAALLSDPIHDTMHITMLAAGLLFWWRIFDFRPSPAGLTYGTRLMMLWIVILSNIGLGAYTTLKSEILYPAYDLVGRLFQMHALTDELIGGFIIWVPSSMMCLIAVLIVLHMWGRHETRVEARRMSGLPAMSDALSSPTTGAELIARAQPRNRAMAIGFGGFALSVFVSVVLLGMMSVLNNASHRGLFTRMSSHRPARPSVR